MNQGNRNNPTTHESSPLHVAIIMDGSGRWAQARGLPRSEGHRQGQVAVVRAAEAALGLGISTLTLFTFSTENWGRPENEVTELMRTFERFFRLDAPVLVARGIRLTVIGRRDRLPVSLCAAIAAVEQALGSGNAPRLHVRFAIDYSGREAILNAARQFRASSCDADEDFARLLDPAEYDEERAPDVDFLIRTGGEQRLSNCPLWEIAYAELYFTSCWWPDFGPAEFDAAMREFSVRHRRFGRIAAAVS